MLFPFDEGLFPSSINLAPKSSYIAIFLSWQDCVCPNCGLVRKLSWSTPSPTSPSGVRGDMQREGSQGTRKSRCVRRSGDPRKVGGLTTVQVGLALWPQSSGVLAPRHKAHGQPQCPSPEPLPRGTSGHRRRCVGGSSPGEGLWVHLPGKEPHRSPGPSCVGF